MSMREWARTMKRQTLALYFAVRDPRTPWFARLIAGAVVAYAISPIDLIPDFIPVLGLLDDIIIVPIGLWLAIRLIPAEVLAEAQTRAERAAMRPVSLRAALVIGAIWLALACLFGWWAYKRFIR